MIKSIFLCFMTLAISQVNDIDSTIVNNKNINEMNVTITFKTLKVGIDVNSKFRFKGGEGDDYIMPTDDGLSLAAEIYINNKFDAGIEMLTETDLMMESAGSFSQLSIYGLYNFYSDENIKLMPKFGFTSLTYDQPSSNYGGNYEKWTSKGGIMYGFQIEYKDKIHLSYTRHFGVISENNSEYYSNIDMDTRASRFNISYAFNF